MSYLLVRDVVDQTVINTAAEVPVFSQTIPAGLWPGRVLKIEQTGRYCNGTSNGRTYTCRLRVNGQTIISAVVAGTTSSASYYAATQRWTIPAVATNQVRAVMRYGTGGAASDTGNFAAITSPGTIGTNRYGDVNTLISDPAYLDLGKPVQLEITVQLSVATATHAFTSKGVWVMLLGDALTPAVRPDLSAHPRRTLRRAA